MISERKSKWFFGSRNEDTSNEILKAMRLRHTSTEVSARGKRLQVFEFSLAHIELERSPIDADLN